MDSHIKTLAEATENTHLKKIIQTHVKSLDFNEETRHLIVELDNAGPLHALEEKEGDKHLNKALAAVYGDDITYELRLPGGGTHEREKIVSRRVQF